MRMIEDEITRFERELRSPLLCEIPPVPEPHTLQFQNATTSATNQIIVVGG